MTNTTVQSTPILVRVQAKGGKFVGPDAGYARVTLRDVKSGTVLAQGIASGGSGSLLETFFPSSTRQPVVTTQSSGAQSLLWLSALPPTIPPAAGFIATLDLGAPTQVEFIAEGLSNGTPNRHSVTQTMWITPGVDLTAEPGVVLVIPGLNVNVLTAAIDGSSLAVTAWVSMMCGCKIDPALPWLPTQFAVTATLTDADGNPVAQAPLAFQKTSTFGTDQPIVFPGPGGYTLTVEAVQPAEGNVGSASVSLAFMG